MTPKNLKFSFRHDISLFLLMSSFSIIVLVAFANIFFDIAPTKSLAEYAADDRARYGYVTNDQTITN